MSFTFLTFQTLKNHYNIQNEKNLHIISFDVPYPADYGGVIEVFYKIKALSEMGVNIYLHCFQYGRDQAAILEKWCRKVYYYPRKKSYQSLPICLPHIIASRTNKQLLQHLQATSYPILFEGLHTCSYLSHPTIKHRNKLVRMHNIEWDYYKKLANSETSILKSAYLHLEAWQLNRFEKVLAHASRVFAISPNEYQYLSTHFNKVSYLPAFHANAQLTSPFGQGTYALYHGNLAVNENHQAALFLVNKVFSNSSLPIPLIIAGKAPKRALREQIDKQAVITLIEYPTHEALAALVANAQVNVLPTFQNTGIKLKLLNALFQGRFCLVNDAMVVNTGLESLCYRANSVGDFRRQLQKIVAQTFTLSHYEKRKRLLLQNFCNQSNAKKILSFI